MIRGEARERHFRQRLENFGCARTLQSEQSGLLAYVFNVSAELVARSDPLEIVFDIGCIHDEHESILRLAVYEKVVDCGSFRRRESGVLRLSVN